MSTVSQAVTGVILAGGKSRRMGQDKAFLTIDGLPLMERVVRIFVDTFASVIIIGGQAERFAAFHLPHYPDLYPGSAMGGLYTGLYHAKTSHIFVSACDVPFPNRAVMDHILSLVECNDVVVAKTEGGFEPLFAVYGKGCLEPMRRQLEQSNFCIYDVYDEVNTRYVSSAELAAIDGAETAFCNLNTPEDLIRLTTQKAEHHINNSKTE